ncbi:MAG: HAD hydrolase-like protein [Paramuribaculum sp.]|nr:HAD hydrolase-like protein [Paramuribaculum sp.]
MFTKNIDYYFKCTSFFYFEPLAALIDMDGTLYDSMPNHAAAWKEMMAEVGIDMPLDEFFRHEGRTGADTINRLFLKEFGREATEEEAKKLYHRKTVLFRKHPDPLTMPGAARMLETLKERNIKRVLVTGSAQSSLISRIDSDFPGAFSPEMRITAADVERGKPDPLPYIKAMSIAGVLPFQSIVIENAPLGVAAGFAARAFTIGVTTGPISEEELYESGAHVVFPSMNDLADKLPILLDELKTHRRS